MLWAWGIFSLLIAAATVLTLGFTVRRWLTKYSSQTHVTLHRLVTIVLLVLPLGMLIRPPLPLWSIELAASSQTSTTQPVPSTSQPRDGQEDVSLPQSRSLSDTESSRSKKPLPEATGNNQAAPTTVTTNARATETTNAREVGTGPRTRSAITRSALFQLPVFQLPVFQLAVRGLAWVWIVGVIVLLVRLVVAHWRTARIWKRAVVTNQSRRLRSLRKIEVRVSTDVSVPICLGLLSPKILLPANAVELTEEELKTCHEHETIHADRRDVMWFTLSSLAACLNWVNPMVWHYRRTFRDDMELACDDQMLIRGENATSYARLLTSLTRAVNGSQVATLSISDRGNLNRRVERIIHASTNRTPPARQMVSCLTLLVCSVAGAALAARPDFQRLPSKQPFSIKKPAIWISDGSKFLPTSDVDILLVVDPDAAEFVANRYRSFEPENRPKVYTVGLTPRVLELLEHGRLDATVSRQPYSIGYRSVETLLQARQSSQQFPRRLVVPSRVVWQSNASQLINEFVDGREITMKDIDAAGVTILFDIPSSMDPWWELVHAGAKFAAEQYGAKLFVNESTNAKTVAPCCDSFRDGIVVTIQSEYAAPTIRPFDQTSELSTNELPVNTPAVLTSQKRTIDELMSLVSRHPISEMKTLIVGSKSARKESTEFVSKVQRELDAALSREAPNDE